MAVVMSVHRLNGKRLGRECGVVDIPQCASLALLDYVSRAHEMEIRPSSVVRPSVASIISEVIAWISFKF